MHAALGVAMGLALTLAFAAQMLRWLRVLQREHYEPASMLRFLGRWSAPPAAKAKPIDAMERTPRRARHVRPVSLSHVAVLLALVAILLNRQYLVVLVSVAYGLFCPEGLSVKGRTSALAWTRRLTTTAVIASTAALVVAALGALTIRVWLLASAMVWAVPLVLDVISRALAPFERRRSQVFVDRAVARLRRVAPRVVAITGSYGKTSTKHHLAQLLADEGGVVASPRSFNNRAGLSRAVNEHLADGTRVFIAEMGTYGLGEIADLCSWCVPDIAVVTAIGPVHLERMKSLDVIERAKFEITELASTVVVNIDDPRLARWPERLVAAGKHVRGAGSRNEAASVRVALDGATWSLVIDGEVHATLAPVVGVQPTNLACAVAAALELGVDAAAVANRLRSVSAVANRANVVVAPSGVVVIDDTFNANPTSAVASLNVLTALDLSGRRVVVTPGLVELGRDQYGENLALGQKVAGRGMELVVVARTNLVPLQVGYGESPRRFNTREEAVAWVRSALVIGDGVLYLNDLPDHYP